MTRPHSIDADAAPAPARDAEAALSAALVRLAALRQQVRTDWSIGIAELLAYSNDDHAETAVDAWAIAPPPRVADRGPPSIDTPGSSAPPLEVDVDTSWLALADTPLELRGRLDFDDEVAAALVRAVDAAQAEAGTEPPVLALAAEADVVVVDTPVQATPDTGALFGAGVLVNFFDVVVSETSRAASHGAASEALEGEAGPVLAYGAAPGILAFAEPPTAAAAPVKTDQAVHTEGDASSQVHPGALADLDTLFALAAAPPPAPVRHTDIAELQQDEVLPLAVGAFAIAFDIIAPDLPSPVPSAAQAVELPAPEPAYGAHPTLVALLDLAPAPVASTVPVRPFDPQSLIDDALADAFETMLCVRDPLETVWDADTLSFTSVDNAVYLADAEAALWNLPRRIPCIQIFLAHPDHETAVRLTRALRLRANALHARAFAEGASFGALDAGLDPGVLWLATDRDCTAFSPVDGDASFPDWGDDADGFITVTAPDIAPRPGPTRPLITEAELDALFAHVDDAQAHYLDDEQWDEPYWTDVDSYLASESPEWRPEDIDQLAGPYYDPANDILDIEVLDAPLRVSATHFWMPGDPADMAVDGDGDDLFIVGAGDDDDAVILVEDGATHAMRTGRAARMDEVIVSVSHAPWTHIDAMPWTRLAALSGVRGVRVTQTRLGGRRVVMAGVLGPDLLPDDVRLVRTDEAGRDIDEPVLRIGGGDALFLADMDAA